MPKTLIIPVRPVKTKLMCDCGKEMKFLKKKQSGNSKLFTFLYECKECNMVYESKKKYPKIDYIDDTKATLSGIGSPLSELLKKPLP